MGSGAALASGSELRCSWRCSGCLDCWGYFVGSAVAVAEPGPVPGPRLVPAPERELALELARELGRESGSGSPDTGATPTSTPAGLADFAATIIESILS